MLDLPPDLLADAAVAGVHRVYGVELDSSPAGLARLDTLLREHMRVGEYTREDFPAALALSLGAFTGAILLRRVADGHWGVGEENLYGSPLPFLVFSRGEHERQINVVEEIMHYLWSGQGLSPHAFYEHHAAELARLGFPAQ